MRNITEELNKQKIYTFIGSFSENNTFTTIDGETIDCMAYRHLRREMSTSIVAINIKYIYEFVNAWVIFQVVVFTQ